MALQDDDKFIVLRGRTEFQVPASDFQDKLRDSDELLIHRGGADYRATGKATQDYFISRPSTIQDTDLLLVNRGGTDYKVNAKDVKAFYQKEYWTVRSEITAIDYTDVGATYDPEYELEDLLFVNGTFYYLWEGQIATSPDAVNWTKISSNGPWASDTTGQNAEVRPDVFLSYANGMFYVVCYKSIYESADCISWTTKNVSGNKRLERYTYVKEATDRNGDDFVWFFNGNDYVMYKYPGNSWKTKYFSNKKPGALCWNNTMKAFNYVVSPSTKVYEMWAGDHIYDLWDVKLVDVKNYAHDQSNLFDGALCYTGDTIAYICYNDVELYDSTDLTYITGTTDENANISGTPLYANEKMYPRIRYDEGIGDVLYGCSHRLSGYGTRQPGAWGRFGLPYWRTNNELFGENQVEMQRVGSIFPSMQFWYAPEKRYIVADERCIWQSWVTDADEIDYKQAGKQKSE